MQQSTLHLVISVSCLFQLYGALMLAVYRGGCTFSCPFNVISDSEDLMWLYLSKSKCVGFWSQCEPDYFHMWLWRPNCNISKIQLLSLNTPALQTETLKWNWNDTCNRSLRLCAWLRSLGKHLPAVSLSCWVFFILFDLVTVMLLSSQPRWRDEHYCR